MQTRIELCEPEQLKALQEIFDAVWLRLEQEGTVIAGDQAMREHLAGCIMACAQDGNGAEVETIRTAVLKFADSLGKLPDMAKVVTK